MFHVKHSAYLRSTFHAAPLRHPKLYLPGTNVQRAVTVAVTV